MAYLIVLGLMALLLKITLRGLVVCFGFNGLKGPLNPKQYKPRHPADTRLNDVVLTSMRCDDVASTSVQRRFHVISLPRRNVIFINVALLTD